MTVPPTGSSQLTPSDLHFVPRLRDDYVRRDVQSESVVWSPIAPEPLALDAVATVMLDVIDGDASVGDLAGDVHEAIGVPLETAERQVSRVIELFDEAGLLTTSATLRDAEREIEARELFVSGSTPCSESASRLGTVTFWLRFGAQTVRVACDSRRGARKLRAALGEFVVEERDDAPLAFVLTAPQGLHRNHRLTERSGFVLSEARGLDTGLHALACHLTALLPPPPGAVRVRARTLMAGDRAVVCLFPLLYATTAGERDLERAGLRLVDRLAVDVDIATGRIVAPDLPWPSLAELTPGPGHAGTGASPSRVLLVDAAAPSGPGLPTPATMVASVARNTMHGDVATILDASVALVVGAMLLATQPADDQIVSTLRELAAAT
jgi:hypothetical protein